MIYVGLDWSRDCHTFEVVDESGTSLKTGVVQNRTKDFEPWSTEIESLGAPVRLIVESGNGLSLPIEEHVLSRGWEVRHVEATSVRSYREHVLGCNNKTDKLDARAIALIGSGPSKKVRARILPRKSLRRITRDRLDLKKLQTALSNRLRQTLAEYWPEFSSDSIPQISRATVLCLLRRSSNPKVWTEWGTAGMQAVLAESGLRTLAPFAEKLLKLAVDHQRVMSIFDQNYLEREVQLLAERVHHCNVDIERTDLLLVELQETDNEVSLIDSIPGAGTVLASGIISEIQDISNFKSESELASYSGIGLRRHQTGSATDYQRNQVKYNRRLKHHLLQLAQINARCDPRSAAYYAKKRKEGKKPLQAQRCLARHLLRLLYKMLKTNSPFVQPPTG